MTRTKPYHPIDIMSRIFLFEFEAIEQVDHHIENGLTVREAVKVFSVEMVSQKISAIFLPYDPQNRDKNG